MYLILQLSVEGRLRAIATVARKFSVILHRMLRDGNEFRRSTKEVHAA